MERGRRGFRAKHEILETIWKDAALAVGLLHLVGPLAVRSTFRFATHCRPLPVEAKDLPGKAAEVILPLIPRIESLGFERVGCYDCGELMAHSRSYVAYFCDRKTNEFANISTVVAHGRAAGYLEFSSRFANGLAIETNTNDVLPLTPENSEIRVFRFPQIEEPGLLYEVHRQLVEKYAAGLWVQGEPEGEEIGRYARMVENHGPRNAELGYMKLAPGGEQYRLTWKGAILITWRGLWPATQVRKIVYRRKMRAELKSLEVRGVAVLQKA